MVGSGVGVGSASGTAVAALSASASRFGVCKNVVISALTSTMASKMPQAAISLP